MSLSRLIVFGVFVSCFAIAVVGSFVSMSDGPDASAEVGTLSEETLATMTPYELGEYYFNQDDDPRGPYEPATARTYYEQVIEEALPGNERAWYQLGRIDFIEGRLLSAIKKFRKQREYFGDTVPNVHYMLGLTYAYKANRDIGEPEDYKKAEEAFLTYMEFDTYAPWPRVDLAWVYFAQGKYEEMIPVLEEGLQYEPNQAWLLNTYGLALLNTGKADQALQVFLEAQEAAAQLSVDDWAAAYRENSPSGWESGLEEFRHIIDENIKLARSQQ